MAVLKYKDGSDWVSVATLRGPKGEDGETPIKGVDYFTEEEVESIEEEAAAKVDISGKQDKLTAGDNITISADNVISAIDTTYSAGTGISIVDGVISLNVSSAEESEGF